MALTSICHATAPLIAPSQVQSPWEGSISGTKQNWPISNHYQCRSYISQPAMHKGTEQSILKEFSRQNGVILSQHGAYYFFKAVFAVLLSNLSFWSLCCRCDVAVTEVSVTLSLLPSRMHSSLLQIHFNDYTVYHKLIV